MCRNVHECLPPWKLWLAWRMESRKHSSTSMVVSAAPTMSLVTPPASQWCEHIRPHQARSR